MPTDRKDGHSQRYWPRVHPVPSPFKRLTAHIIPESGGPADQPNNDRAVVIVQDWGDNKQCRQTGQPAVHAIQAASHWDIRGINILTGVKPGETEQTGADYVLFGAGVAEVKFEVQDWICEDDDWAFEEDSAETDAGWQGVEDCKKTLGSCLLFPQLYRNRLTRRAGNITRRNHSLTVHKRVQYKLKRAQDILDFDIGRKTVKNCLIHQADDRLNGEQCSIAQCHCDLGRTDYRLQLHSNLSQVYCLWK